jgi:archaea-specific RecJ-like exonuclease
MESKYERAKQMTIDSISSKQIRKDAIVVGLVDKVVQTGGPTVFALADGTGNLSLKGFVAPGERAYPNIESGDYVEAEIKIDEFNGELEGNILKITKKVGAEMEQLKNDIDHQQRERARVITADFMLNNPILEKLKAPILKAAEEIRLAIIQSRPIIVRHHNDTDGYCSGFALERAILPLIQRQHTGPKAAWEYFKRAPSMAPYYEIEDSIKDTAMSLRDVAKFSAKMPLIIIADNGSSQEDLMAIKQAKIHGSDIIVIDHHDFGEDVVSPEVMSHINPHLVGESGSEMSAGMLCAEVSRFINENVENISQIPALAGFADRIDLAAPETMEAYLKIATKEGYTKTLLKDISLVIEYVSVKVRFMEAREYVGVLFGEPREQQKKLVSLMAPHIRDLDAKGLAIGKSAAEVEKLGNTTLQTIQIEASFPGFGFFPKPGRSTGILHDNLQKEKGVTSLISIGIMNTAMTFRATDEANFSTHELIKTLQEKLPNAFVEGGGHKNAGAINYIPRMKEDVYREVRKFIIGL